MIAGAGGRRRRADMKDLQAIRATCGAIAARCLGMGIILALAWLALPGDYTAMGRGLDVSWAYAINAAGAMGLRFGRELIFTYGPLGWLAMPMAVGHNLFWALVFSLALHGLLVAALAVHAASGAWERLAMFAGAWLMLIGAGLPREYQWLLLVALLLGTALRSPRHAGALAAAAAILGAVFLHIKFSLGIAALATMGLFHLLNLGLRNPRAVRRLLEAAALLAAVESGLACLLFANSGDYWLWLRGSWELAAGYSSAMSLPGPGMEVVFGVLLLVLYIGLSAVAWTRDRGSALIPVLAAGICLAAFKHGFVRQDAHVLIFFTTASGIFAIWMLFARRGAFPASVAALLLALPLALAVGSRHGALHGGVYYRLLSGQAAMEKVDYLGHRPEYDRRFQAQFRAALKASAMPGSALEEIRAAGAGVDALPWDLTWIPANNLRWRAQPLLQLYSAYTPWLDRFAAAHYLGAAPPEYVLLHYGALDGRYLAWDAPLVWQTVLRCYAWQADCPADGLILLRRRGKPLPEPVADGGAILTGEQWLDLPGTDDLLFAALDLRLNLPGRILNAFFRAPPLQMEIEYDEGQRYLFQLTPSVAGHGLQINFLPERYNQLAQFWRGAAPHRVRRIRLAGPGRNFYPVQVPVRWRKMPIAVKYR